MRGGGRERAVVEGRMLACCLFVSFRHQGSVVDRRGLVLSEGYLPAVRDVYADQPALVVAVLGKVFVYRVEW